ncbi:MAG: hypothetical protein Q9225_004066 [Loekoesia sp. 1 TL-2023]
MSTNKVTGVSNTITMDASNEQGEVGTSLSQKQIKQLAEGILIRTTPRLESMIQDLEHKEQLKKASLDNAPHKKVHRQLSRRTGFAKSDRVTRFRGKKTPRTSDKPRPQRLRLRCGPPPGNGNSSNDNHSNDDPCSRIRRINCRFRIPESDDVEYWCRGKRMVCGPGFKPWEEKTGVKVETF